MCREQLVNLRPHVKKFEAEGAAILAMSTDTPEQASRLALDLNLSFPILSDPDMGIVREYDMEGKRMSMPEMGYAVIDRQGRIFTKQIDRRFGENADNILRALRQAKRQA